MTEKQLQNKRYYQKHKQQVEAYNKWYSATAKGKIACSRYHKSAKGKIVCSRAHKQYLATNKCKVQAAKYRASVEGKTACSRAGAKRNRNLGFIPLNEYFEGSNAHHRNNKQVIHIPEKLHQSIAHRLSDWQSMAKINLVAERYLFANR